MDEVEFRSFWMGTGAAAFVGGFVVSATDGVTLLVSSPNDREFRVAVALILLSILVMILGTFAIIAAISDKWLPGREAMERREADRTFLLLCLGAFLATGQALSLPPGASTDECFEWMLNLSKATKDAFSTAHSMAMFSGAQFSEKADSWEALLPAVLRLTNVIDRFNTMKSKRGFTEKSARNEEWFTYSVAACPFDFLGDR